MVLFNDTFFNRRPRMAAFDLALNLLRNGADDLLSPAHVNQLAAAQNHLFRNTFLTPGNTLQLFVQQVARGNVACSAMRHLAGEDFSDSAWCQARSRLPLELIDQVHRQVVVQGQRQLNSVQTIGDQSYRWRGHRTFVIDGASDSMPDTPELRSHYGVPGASSPGLGFPASHLLLLMDHRSGLFIDCQDAPGNTHDASVASKMHRHLQPGDILLGDDAFGSYAHIALLLQAHLHAIMPVHHKRIVDFKPDRAHAHPRQGKSTKRLGKPRSRVIEILGREDQLVEYFKPPRKPEWMNQQQWQQVPESIIVREIRRAVSRHGFRPIMVTILTTLLDPQKYPADELIELRLSRWMIETNLRHLKVTLGMSVLKCKTLDGVQKERTIFLLVYNLIRLIMLKAAWRQGVNVNRLSFADTLAWLRYGDLHQPVDLKANPLRSGRLEPRAIKRNNSRFPFMTKPRAVLKSQLREKYCVAT
jgi:hypothetical protein